MSYKKHVNDIIYKMIKKIIYFIIFIIINFNTPYINILKKQRTSNIWSHRRYTLDYITYIPKLESNDIQGKACSKHVQEHS